ncbi:MAG: glycine--tRNA ligase subunit beta [Betaproteobacteria bacterium]|nr:MAG: glycine--tRNA ligase subunit beta [Betaproteobacteria bacterium]
MPKKKAAKAPGAASLLVEILTEELPPKSLLRIAEVFRDALASNLNGSSLLPFPHHARCFASPRRLAVLIDNVANRAIDMHSDTSGPSVAAGTKAAEGFAKKYGVTVDALKRVSTAKGEVYVASYTTKGAQLDDVLAQKVDAALKVLPISKVMRWGEGEAQFVRPVHGLVMMHGGRVVPGTVLGVPAGNTTSGHRFMGAASIRLANADEYEARLLKDGRVIADFAARKSEIDKQLLAEAKRQKASLGEYQDLLGEVTALVEFPAVYAGEFDASFLEVPQECLILTMRQNQKYFPLFSPDGKLLPKFLIVSNMRVDDPRPIVDGNERVVRPRLEDARFFFNQDQKTRLEARVPQLAKVVFHNKLGSQLERMQRIKLLAGEIARSLRVGVIQAERAAELSKVDLLTAMVGEFPELQGVMGRYYALHDSEPREVADAIEQHYRPRFAGDKLPEGPIASAVALADKLDSLAGLFSIKELPTGDKDPFGLRRAALGVIRIVVENQLPLSLWDLVNAAFEPFKGKAQMDLQMFFTERMRSYFLERGYSANEVEAVLSLNPVAIALIPKQLEAVRAFSALPEAASLAAANKRIANILRQAEAKGEAFGDADVSALKEPAEISLFEALQTASRSAKPLFESGDFAGYLKAFAALKSPVDSFFDVVMVMTDDKKLRENRLALLTAMRKAMNRFSDISKLAT